MQFSTTSSRVDCPYCGEAFELIIDPVEPEQAYIEDCFVCCQPIHLQVTVHESGEVEIIARSENDC